MPEEDKHYLVISAGKIVHTSAGIDSARLWAKRYQFAVILECNTVPLEAPEPTHLCNTCTKCLPAGCIYGYTTKGVRTECKDYIKDEKNEQ